MADISDHVEEEILSEARIKSDEPLAVIDDGQRKYSVWVGKNHTRKIVIVGRTNYGDNRTDWFVQLTGVRTPNRYLPQQDYPKYLHGRLGERMRKINANLLAPALVVISSFGTGPGLDKYFKRN